MLVVVFFIASLAATLGAICGMGGGVLMKPAIDALGVMSPATTSFLSGCTVLAMSTYSVARDQMQGNREKPLPSANTMALGAVLGGMLGKALLQQLCTGQLSAVRVIQSASLFVITVFTTLYSLNGQRIQTRHLSSRVGVVVIGLLLGLVSAFLGIGGGPLNLVALSYFFSLSVRDCAKMSLRLIFWSQLSALLLNVFSGSIPPFVPAALALMVAGGFGGSILGRRCGKKMHTAQISKLVVGMNLAILAVCVYNILAAL